MGTLHRIHPSLPDPPPQSGPLIYSQADMDAAVAKATRKAIDAAVGFVEAELSGRGPRPGRRSGVAS